MRPPIIVAEGLDVSFFSSVERAALELEGPDVIEGVYQAYDADGRPLRIRSLGGARDYSARVVIEADPSSDVAPTALAQLLRSFLAELDRPVDDHMPLSVLVETAATIAGVAG